MTALGFIGLAIAFISAIWLLVISFKTSIVWGLLCFFLPVVSIVFVILHWQESKKAFGWYVLGIVLVIIAAVNNPGMIHGR